MKQLLPDLEATNHFSSFTKEISNVLLLHPLFQTSYKIQQTNSEAVHKS